MGAASVTAGQRITASLINGLPVSIPLVTGSVSNSASEAVIGTFTVPANDITATGSGYQLRVFGSADDTGTPTLTLRARINGLAGTQVSNVFSAITCRTTTAGMTWNINGSLYFTTVGASAVLQGELSLDEVLASGTPAWHGGLTFSGNPAAFDNTAQWTLVVTAQWSAASASNIARTLVGAMYRI